MLLCLTDGQGRTVQQFAALPKEVAEKLEIIFFGDPDRAVWKSIEI
jgi:hypothetical protein